MSSRWSLSPTVAEFDVAGVYVGDVDAERSEMGQNFFDVWPVVFEALCLLLLPILPDFRRVIWRSIGD